MACSQMSWTQGQGSNAEGYPYLPLTSKLATEDCHGYVQYGFYFFNIKKIPQNISIG